MLEDRTGPDRRNTTPGTRAGCETDHERRGELPNRTETAADGESRRVRRPQGTSRSPE
jgi:hypothetical protein